MKKASAVISLLIAMPLFGGTWTWIGDGSDLNYYTPANWSAPDGADADWPNANERIQVRQDTVVISGGFAVLDNASREMPKLLMLENGASYATTGEIQFNRTADTNPLLKGGSVTGTMISAQGTGYISAEDCAITITDTGHNGFWQNGDSYLNLIVGERKGSFTYLKSITNNPFWFFSHTKAGDETTTAPCIRLENKVIGEDEFLDTFQFEENGDYITLSFAPVSDWRIVSGAVSGVGETTATINATVKNVASDTAYVYYAYGTSQSAVESALGSAAAMTRYSDTAAVADDSVTVPLTGLTANTPYYYAFALVNGGEVVATTSVSSFIPTAYDCIYENGEWTPGEPARNGTEKILFRDSITLAGYDNTTFASFTIDVGDGNAVTIANYTKITLTGALTVKSGSLAFGGNDVTFLYDAVVLEGGTFARSGNLDFATDAAITVNGGTLDNNGEIATGEKTVRNACVKATVFTGGNAAIQASASRFVSTVTGRWHELTWGFYPGDAGKTFFNFIPSAPADGVYYPACGYTYACNGEENAANGSPLSTADALNVFLVSGRIKVNGETLTAEQAAGGFIVLTNATASTQTLTMFDTLDGSAPDEVALMDGAYVKLTESVKLKSLTMLGANSILDLNGHALRLAQKGLTVNGTNYTSVEGLSSAQIVDSAGNGSVVYGTPGMSIIVR